MKFGDPDAFYSQRPLHFDSHRVNPNQSLLINLIEKYHPEAKGRVEAAVKRWRPYITEKLKQDTGLKLRHQKIPSKILSIKTVTSVPPALMEIFNKVPSFAWKFLLSSNQFKHAEQAIRMLDTNSSEMANQLGDYALEPSVISEASSTILNLIGKIREFIEKSGIDEALNKLGQDQLLGAYFYRVPAIEIYWPSIAVFSSQMRCSVEELTFVILTHEMAHYFTHHCFDLEGELWDTDAFANTDKKIVEGLAQHYTQIVCKDLENNHYNPYMNVTFEKMLKCQSIEYTDFMSWLPEEKHKNEALRLALINVRKHNIGAYEDFKVLLMKSQNALKK